jgi:hypothetical protein
MEISEAKVEELRNTLAEARKAEAQAFALGELSRVFPEKDKDIDPFIVLPRLIAMHESGMLTIALATEERAQEMLGSFKKACTDLTAVRLQRRRKVQAIVLAVAIAVLGLIWFLS